jgi:hypothetical protein
MKNFALTITLVCTLTFSAVSAPATDYNRFAFDRDQRIALTWPWSNRLDKELNHLNRMRGQVRWQFHNYKSKPQLRRDFFAVSHDIDRINARHRQGNYNGRELRREIERAHHELHRIELALRVKPNDLYRWR